MVMTSKVNSPVEGEKKNKLVFSLSKIVESLSKEAREEFAEEFSEDLKEFLSKTAVYKAINGRIHLSNDTILAVVLTNPKAKKWVMQKAREEAENVLRAIEALSQEEDGGRRNK
ncbi:hypothetical protein [Saccharolobus islandicus]|nr:hypothetical protein [Sulfolobus islandicus]